MHAEKMKMIKEKQQIVYGFYTKTRVGVELEEKAKSLLGSVVLRGSKF